MRPGTQRDIALPKDDQRVYEENFRVYRARKAWRQRVREGILRVVHRAVERLIRSLGLEVPYAGSRIEPPPALDRLVDRVKRQFKADRPDHLWVADCSEP